MGLAAAGPAAMLVLGLAAALMPLFLAAALSTPLPSLISMPTDGRRGRGPAPVVVSIAEGLTPYFYNESCPDVRTMVRSAVQEAVREDVTITAGLLRIMFHDCFPQGCDASLLVTGGTRESEQLLRQNWRLHQGALQLIEDIRVKVHAACGPTVSCADITVLSTHDAVVASGGKPYTVPLGRLDSLGPAEWKYVRELPPPTLSIDELIAAFGTRNLDETDLVALSGAHTVGRAHCMSFYDRFKDSDSDDFAQRLRVNCTQGDINRMQDLDVVTPDAFDNNYFGNLLKGQGVLTSDMQLLLNTRTRELVNGFARDEWWFWNQFGTSMAKMGSLQGPQGNVGKVRRNSCFVAN